MKNNNKVLILAGILPVISDTLAFFAKRMHLLKSLFTLNPPGQNPKRKKAKYCSACDGLATVEAIFDVEESGSAIENYLDLRLKSKYHIGVIA